MKRLLAALVGLCLIATGANSYWQSRSQVAISGGSSPVTVSGATTDTKNCAFGATCTSNTITVPTGFVVLGIGGENQGGAGLTITSAAVNSPCTGSLSVVQNPATANGSHVASLFAGTLVGGSCTITITPAGASLSIFGIALEALSNVISTTAGTACSNAYPSNSGFTPYVCSSSITIATDGIAIAVLSSSSINTLTSTNLTIDAQSSATMGIAIAHSSAAGSITPALTTGNVFDKTSLSAAPWR